MTAAIARLVGLAVLVGFAAIVLASAVYRVNEAEQVINFGTAL